MCHILTIFSYFHPIFYIVPFIGFAVMKLYEKTGCDTGVTACLDEHYLRCAFNAGRVSSPTSERRLFLEIRYSRKPPTNAINRA